ncbi:MAG: FMN-binding protein [Thermoguttaceae bacterium]
MSEEPKQGGYIGQAWLVILLALLYGGALAGVQTTLGPIIETNKKNETYSVIPKLVEGAVKASKEEIKAGTLEIIVVGENGKKQKVYKAIGKDGKLKGWVLAASGQGFADKIELLVGLSADLSTITGMDVLDQKETPGLGNFIDEEDFRDQFAGKPTTEPLLVVKTDPVGDNEILALSGATISSQSVADIVNRAIENLKGPISKLPADEPREKSTEESTDKPAEEPTEPSQ